MEPALPFDPERAMIDFALTPLPVTLPLGKAANYGSHAQCEGDQPRNATPSPTGAPDVDAIQGDSKDFEKKELRRLKDRIRRRKVIIRRNCEVQALRSQIDELSEQIQRKTGAEMNSSVWKATAGRQVKALQERRLLREEVRKRAGWIRGMRNLVHGQPQQAEALPASVQAEHPLLFQLYIRELDAVSKQTNDIFRAFAMDSSPQSSMIKTTREKQGDTEFFQSYGKQLMPFEYRQTCHFLWQLVALAHRQEGRQLHRQVEDPANTVAITFRYCDQDQTASVTEHYVIRRYTASYRTVLVWRALHEGEGVFRGMHSDETGWCVIHAATLDACTVVETCTRVVPMPLGSAASHVSKVDQFTSTVLKSAEEDILQISMKLDKVLLEEASELFKGM
ncbi:hypothetical protein PHYPSEUDO_002097 [Phytophthora pseudosyringae]|uniref:M96 mating-specific protein family n=1 Tax=Phytophthora pseudosyringae TaxID=221518 RepID=A0A8T1VUP6_9STRA|nr:hypothetical protein PHYPSEUDO_002097 [Phytophthora pseudosyringae]